MLLSHGLRIVEMIGFDDEVSTTNDAKVVEMI
jgi:hypothetical protein